MKPVRVRLVYGEPISVEELAQYDGRDKDDALINLVRSRIVECQREAETWRTNG